MTLNELILKHHEPYRQWDRDIFDAWLGWHIHNGFVIRALDDDSTTVGVGIIRPVMKAEDASDHYEYDPEGSVLFIDLLICLHPAAMMAIGLGVLQRFGQRETVAWKRAPFFVTETHSFARLRRHVFRKALTYG
jgi:hypothetical protein